MCERQRELYQAEVLWLCKLYQGDVVRTQNTFYDCSHGKLRLCEMFVRSRCVR